MTVTVRVSPGASASVPCSSNASFASGGAVGGMPIGSPVGWGLMPGSN
jgi:hypothetical protein